ncbi:MAG: hypothetical protein AAF125_15620 [Chloroflexota bacterium]
MCVFDRHPKHRTETFTRTWTEEQINDSFRANNPRRVRVANVAVNLQPNQAVIDATITTRNETYTATGTIVASIENSRVRWTATTVTINGVTASAEQIDQYNAAVTTAWENLFRGQVSGVVDSVVVTENDITLSGTVDGSRVEALDEAVADGTVTEEENPRLFRFWERFSNRDR